MRIDHVGIWTGDLDALCDWYRTYFQAVAGREYHNPDKGFRSCFLSFAGGGRLEVMCTTALDPVTIAAGRERMGLTHVAISVGSETAVDALAQRIGAAGFPVLDGPRRTGDGYYEAVVLDPDGNRVEITA